MGVLLKLISVIILFCSITAIPVEEGSVSLTQNISSYMYPNEMGRSGRNRRDVPLTKPRRWPNAIIPYDAFKVFLSTKSWKILSNAIRTIEYWTCVRFEPFRFQKNFLVIVNAPNKGCSAEYVGYHGGRHTLYLEEPKCYNKIGDVIHELLHIVGLIDEHRRPERDQYLTINEENVEDKEKERLTKYNQSQFDNYGIPYDYSSVMQHNETVYTKNGKKTMEPTSSTAEIGQRDGMSVRDAIAVNKLYECFYHLDRTKYYSDVLPDILTTPLSKDELNIMYITKKYIY